MSPVFLIFFNAVTIPFLKFKKCFLSALFSLEIDKNMSREFMWGIPITVNSIQAAVLPSNRITFLQWNSPVAATYEISCEEFPTLSAPHTLFSYSTALGEFHNLIMPRY